MLQLRLCAAIHPMSCFKFHLMLADMRKISVRGALQNAEAQKCSHCGKPGASVLCARLCSKRLHLHCLVKSGCDVDEGVLPLRVLARNNAVNLQC